MVQSGFTVYRYRGIYSREHHYRDTTPAKLGHKLAEEIPEDPRDFETWKNTQIKRLTTQQNNRLKSIRNTGHPVANDRDLPSAFPTYIDNHIIWAYVIDLDNDAFIICKGNDDARRLYLNLRKIPRHLFLEHDYAIILLKRPGVDEDYGDGTELSGGYLSAAYYDTASDQLPPRYLVQYLAANKEDIESVKDMTGNIILNKNRSNFAIFLLHCFVSCYKDFFEYQRGKYEKSGYISRKLAVAVLSYLSYGAGLGRLYSRKYIPPVKKEIPVDLRYGLLPSEADSTPWWKIPSQTSSFFWLTEKVLVLVENGPLKEGEPSKASAAGRVCLNVKNGFIPEKPSRFPEAPLERNFFVIVLSNSLDSVFFLKLTKPERHSDPIETQISPVLQFIPYYFWCLDHEEGEIQPGILSCMEFIAHAHTNIPDVTASDAESQSKEPSRLLSLATEILQRILDFCPYRSFTAISQTCHTLRSICNSTIRIGNWTLLSINLEINPSVSDRYVAYMHSVEVNCTLQSCYVINTETNVRLGSRIDDAVNLWDPDEPGINAAEVQYRQWRKRIMDQLKNPRIGMAQGPAAPFVEPTFLGRMFRDGEEEQAFGDIWGVDVASTPYLAPLRIYGIELKTLKVVGGEGAQENLRRVYL